MLSKNFARSASSLQSVNVSSNWSVSKNEQPMGLGLVMQSKLCGKVETALFVLWMDDKRRQRSHVQGYLRVAR
jgi:hypothetical protein